MSLKLAAFGSDPFDHCKRCGAHSGERRERGDGGGDQEAAIFIPCPLPGKTCCFVQLSWHTPYCKFVIILPQPASKSIPP